METHPYFTTLSDAEWELLRPLLPPPPRTGHPRRHSLRTLLDAIFYAVRAGHLRSSREWNCCLLGIVSPPEAQPVATMANTQDVILMPALPLEQLAIFPGIGYKPLGQLEEA